MEEFANHTVVIVGGAKGIGLATVRLFLEAGAHVLAGDIDADALEAAVTHLKARSPQAALVGMKCDVSDEASVQALMEAACRPPFLSPPTVAVNCAGILGATGPIDRMDYESWRKTNSVHFDGTFLVIKHSAIVMKRAPWQQDTGVVQRAIVCLASIGGMKGGLAPHPYSASKAAIIQLVKNAAAELVHSNIRVNAIAPGAIPTSMTGIALASDASADGIEKAREHLASHTPMPNRRVGSTEDIAHAIMFLASPVRASYVNAHCMVVDAGITEGGAGPVMPHFSQESWAVPMYDAMGKRGV